MTSAHYSAAAAAHIVLVEDDADLQSMLQTFLEKQGFMVSACGSFKEMVAALKNGVTPNAFILDLMLPDKNGIEISQYIRSSDTEISTTPILILTAQDNELLEVTALNEGATSYLNKPVRPHVLLAHLNALLRQHTQHASKKHDKPEGKLAKSTVTTGLLINDTNRTASLNGETLTLSTAEFDLLNLLYNHSGKTISRDYILNNVRGIAYDGLNRSIDMRISTLRKKLGDHKPPYRHIKTVRGKGYLFVQDKM